MSEDIKLPIDFVARINEEDFYPKQLLESLENDAPISIRQHPKKANHSFEVKSSITCILFK
jgi:hypothetical protein